MATKKKTPPASKRAAPKKALKAASTKAAARKPAAAKARAKPPASAVAEREPPHASGNGASLNGKALVIVESPAKAKTIGKYLGRGYA